MTMKKSKHIELILITAALASCQQPKKDWDSGRNVYLRSDTSAPYTRRHTPVGMGLWYYAFRPYGSYSFGRYNRLGYYSGALHEASNVGSNGFKSGIVRGGFGRGAYSVSS
ncbi:MAG: hypothetical protein EOP50_13380 [Sphingobacteriales bacterium]|nr:MAG: hypothetical protein EOP50_13380 [Sphingobacteriales bacterium]